MAALGFAFVAGLVLARKMVGPIQALRAGAARIGSGDLTQRISVKTGDELEALADQFNDMAGRLQESYADLEKKVELRTHELAQSVAELRALGEVSQAVNSTLDLQEVLTTIVSKAVQLSDTDAGAIYDYDETNKEFGLRSTYGMDDELIAAFKERHIRIGDAGIGQAASQRAPLQIADLQNGAAIRHSRRGRAGRLPRCSDRSAARRRTHRRSSGGPPQNGRANSPSRRSTCCRPSPPNRCWRSRTRACSMRSRTRAGSSRRRASTNRSSSPT